MKIGILTYHRTLNYGGCLQALATRVVLEQMGHQAYYVDYWPQYHDDVYAKFSVAKLKRIQGLRCKARLILNTVKYSKYLQKRQNNFAAFINEEIVPFCKPLTEEYDAVIYGSDQIWRKQPVLNDYNPIYFANNDIKADKHIAFSASMGILPKTDGDNKKLERLLSHFTHIAVREQELKDCIERIGIDNVELTADPTLLLSNNLWSSILYVRGYSGPKYVLVYALHDTFDFDQIKTFAQRRGLMVKTIYGSATQSDTDTIITTAGPTEFLRLVKNAEFVFSSSFHGLAFSLIFGKEFFVSFDSNAGRAKSLLNEVGLANRFMAPKTVISNDIEPINYTQVNLKLQSLRDKSLIYLNEALK